MATEIKTVKKIDALADRLAGLIQDFDTNAVEDLTQDLNASATAHVFLQIKTCYEKLDLIKKAMGKVYDRTRMVVVPNKMEEEGLENMRVPGVGTVYLSDDLQASIKDREAGYDWLEEHGYGDLITNTVNASSLKALLRRRIRDGEEVPEDIFKVTPVTRAAIR